MKNCSYLWKEEEWYKCQSSQGMYMTDLIFRYHKYFSAQDRKYRFVVRSIKVTILALAMASTIILGLKSVIGIDTQVVIGLFLSAFITFVTAISSYFNYEEYWMRNITIHIQLNILRDNFLLEVRADKMNDSRIAYYMDELQKIQQSNILYWEKAIKKV